MRSHNEASYENELAGRLQGRTNETTTRALITWVVMALVGALGLAVVLAIGGCPQPGTRGAAFASGAEHCALDIAGASALDLVDQAEASAQGAPGAPTWGAFSTGELLTKGIPLAICIVEQAIAALDLKMPPLPADASGNVQPAQAQPAQRAFLSPSTPREFNAAEAVQLQAHARLADFLSAHGVTHAHAVVDGGGGQ